MFSPITFCGDRKTTSAKRDALKRISYAEDQLPSAPPEVNSDLSVRSPLRRLNGIVQKIAENTS